jgi:hypothetical protein
MESCNCPVCISACRNDPGRLVPEDLQKLARLLGLTEAGLLEQYLVKIPLCPKDAIYALAPAKRKGKRFVAEPGKVAPDYYAQERGVCVFLDEQGSCTIQGAKPFECSAYMGCKNTFLGRPYKKKYVEEYFLHRWRKAGKAL